MSNLKGKQEFFMAADEKLWEIKNCLFIYMYLLRILHISKLDSSDPTPEFLKINWFLLITYPSIWENGRYNRKIIDTV